jgi:hypothetical protein
MPSCYQLRYDQCVLFMASFVVVITECMLKKILWPRMLERKQYVGWPTGSDVETRNVDGTKLYFCAFTMCFQSNIVTAGIYCSAVCKIQTICLQCFNDKKCMPNVQSALPVNTLL